MNREQRHRQAEEPEVEAALRNFRASVHQWSEREYARPRSIERTRWSRVSAGIWSALANPALGGAVAAALLVASIAVPVDVHHEHAVAVERRAQLELHRKQALEQERKAATAAPNQVDDGAFLDDVDSDIAQAAPDAMQPLASLMDDGSAGTRSGTSSRTSPGTGPKTSERDRRRARGRVMARGENASKGIAKERKRGQG